MFNFALAVFFKQNPNFIHFEYSISNTYNDYLFSYNSKNSSHTSYLCTMIDNFTTAFFGIGKPNGKTPENLRVLWRSV
jgi:hypothetical protein